MMIRTFVPELGTCFELARVSFVSIVIRLTTRAWALGWKELEGLLTCLDSTLLRPVYFRKRTLPLLRETLV